MRSGWAWSWVGLALAVSCALPELTIGEGDDGAGDGESGDGGTGLGGSNGGAAAGKGGKAAGGSSGNSAGSSGKGGQGGTDSGGGSGAEGGTGNTGGTDTGGTDTGGASGTDGTGGQGGTTGGNAGSPNGGSGGAGQGGTTAGQGGTTAGQGGTTGGRGGTGGAGQGGTTAGQGGTAGKGGTATGGAGQGGTTAGQGGTTAGTAGKGGTGGTAGTGGSCPTPSQLFPASGNLGSLDGRLVATPCVNANTDDCTTAGAVYNGLTTPCQSGSLTLQQDFMVGGTPGAMYTVQMRFYGILGPKNYGTSVTRESGTTRPTNSNTGATPAPFAYTNAPGAVTTTASDYENNELHVLDQNLQVFRQFFLNSDTQEGHWTYVVNYVKTIPVIGGGRIRMRHFDRNCRQIKNCHNGTAQGTAAQCVSYARSVNISSALPQPVGLVQPGLGNDDGNSGQWLLVNVLSVGCP